jgi:DNA-binding NtrC family response regulator
MHGKTTPSFPVHVLHVDDDPHILEITKAFLERSGNIRVFPCSSVQEAFAHLTEHPVDVFISDYEMPEMSGLELLQTIRGHGCDIPFILFTGRGRESVAMSAINSGATFYVQKGGEPRSQYAELSDKVMKAYRQYRDQLKIRHLSGSFRFFGKYQIPFMEMKEEKRYSAVCAPGSHQSRISEHAHCSP